MVQRRREHAALGVAVQSAEGFAGEDVEAHGDERAVGRIENGVGFWPCGSGGRHGSPRAPRIAVIWASLAKGLPKPTVAGRDLGADVLWGDGGRG